MTLEIHEDTEGNLSVWRDPYVWVDPFAEAEEWALRWADERQRSDVRRMREAHENEVRVLRAHNESLLRQFANANASAFSVKPVFVSTQGLDLTGLKIVKES